MKTRTLQIDYQQNRLLIRFEGEFDLYSVAECKQKLDQLNTSDVATVIIDLKELDFIDTAAALFLYNFYEDQLKKGLDTRIESVDKDISDTLKLVKETKKESQPLPQKKSLGLISYIGKQSHSNYVGFISFLAFVGELFVKVFYFFKTHKNIRYKEIFFEINESAVHALGIVALTSFLVGVVVAYQSAYQLKLYGANIYIVNMLGLSMLRELSPMLTAIVIAGRSGSSYTAQIGAMKITQELDAMRTMGFDPYRFLVLPRIIALMITMPILIFVSDMFAIFGGMIISHVDLGISVELFLDRFNTVIALKHFLVGIVKGPFFAFLIATIGIYRGLLVKDDTQSIGVNTTKSVVESIFAVIVCDAVFSIAFTNLGI